MSQQYTRKEQNFLKSLLMIPKESIAIVLGEYVFFYPGTKPYKISSDGTYIKKIPKSTIDKVLENERERLANEIMNLSNKRNIEITRVPYQELCLVQESTLNPEMFHSRMLRYRPVVNSDLYENPYDRLKWLYSAVSSSTRNSTIIWPALSQEDIKEYTAMLEGYHNIRWLKKIFRDLKKRFVTRDLIEEPDRNVLSSFASEDLFERLMVIPHMPEFNVPFSGKSISSAKLKVDGPATEHPDYFIGLIKEEDIKRQREGLANGEREEG
jgi:hypothetical protein